MGSTPLRRTRSTGPSRSGSSARAGRGNGSASRAGRAGTTGRDPAQERPESSGPRQPPTDGESVSSETVPTSPSTRTGGRAAATRSGRTGGSRPAGTRPGTAPSASASSGGRRIGRLTTRAAPTAVGTSRAPSQLIRQIAVLGLVFCAVALVLAVPFRNYLVQRADLGVEIGKEQQLEQTLQARTQEQQALADPAYIAEEAKRRLQYIRPGETAYVVHAPPLPAAKVAAAPSVTPDVPWYSHLWDTLSDPTQTAVPGASPRSESVVPSKAGR